MKKRNVIRIISFFSAAVVAVGGMWFKEMKTSKRYQQMLENEYSSALSELDSALNSISLILEKTRYVESPKKFSSLSAQAFCQAELAKTALAKLPVGTGELESLYRFLSQVGNYAVYVSKNIIGGSIITEEEKNNLSLLYDTAKSVSQAVSDTQINYNNVDYWTSEIKNAISDSYTGISIKDGWTELEELTDYPTLIYDGPYSDHILTKTPLMTANADSVTKQEALKVASKVSSQDTEKLSYDGFEDAKIPCYRFTNEKVTVTVSKNGGYPVYMRKNRTSPEIKLDYGQALYKASRYLSGIGIKNMTETYYYTDEGVCVINFAYLDGQTVCYTDLIKVGVAMDNGEIVFFESSGYLTNHTERAFEIPEHTKEDAAQMINPELEIHSVSIALIPTESLGEVRCFELLCKGQENEEILVYINTLTLETEQIFILLKSDNGTLVK